MVLGGRKQPRAWNSPFGDFFGLGSLSNIFCYQIGASPPVARIFSFFFFFFFFLKALIFFPIAVAQKTWARQSTVKLTKGKAKKWTRSTSNIDYRA